MLEQVKLPIGVEDFGQIRTDGFYYVDKTGLIRMRTISIRDTNVQKPKKENFYHGVLLGLLSHRDDWWILSSAEAGEGYSDILIEQEELETGIVIEVKYAENDALERDCREALDQIETRNYAQRLLEDGMKVIHTYGVACYKKHCKIMMG